MNPYIEFAKALSQLKKVKRSGWVREGVENPEDVADHSFRTAILAMILGPHLSLNTSKLVEMALLHDCGEIVTKDIVAERWGKVDVSSKNRKELLEKKAIEEIFGLISFGKAGDLTQEFLELKTREAKILKQLDKLEMALQAIEYEQEQSINLTEFLVDSITYIKEPKLKQIMDSIMKLHNGLYPEGQEVIKK